MWTNEIVRWVVGDTQFLSVPFTWLMPEARRVEAAWRGRTVIGGPGVMKPTEYLDPTNEPVRMHNPLATFTTRGCPNACSFCAVPKLEPDFYEIYEFQPAPIVCDNNLLAASQVHIRRVIESLRHFPYADFNQGFDARLFTPEIADMIGGVRAKVRFAFDSWADEGVVKDAIDLCRKRASNKIGVYCLVGFDDTPDDAIAKLELIRSWGIRPTAMRYQPLDAETKNSHVASEWTERALRRVTRYYNRLRWLEHIPFSEYRYTPEDHGQLVMEST